jgi:hypothetical protein
MIGPENAEVGSAFLITYQGARSDLTVTAKTLRVSDGTSQTVTLSHSASLSSDPRQVYSGEFTPSETGWYVIHYEARLGSSTVDTDVGRVYVGRASTSSGSGSGSGASSSSATDGTELEVPVILEGTSGTLTFTVGSR